MKKILFGFMIFSLAIMMSCKQDNVISSVVVEGAKPVSSFTYTREYMVITFNNTSTDAESYYWEFGDGTTSSERSPVHTYASAGNYDVSLKVNSAAGYSSTSDKVTIFVAGPVGAFFSFAAGLGLKIDFDAGGSANIQSASWDFGDGSEPGSGISTTHSFPAEGTYNVTVTVTGLLGDVATMSLSVTVVENYNLIKGGDMEASSAMYWTVLAEAIPMTWGYTADGPTGGEGGCLRFAHYVGGTNSSLIYQAVDVEEGQKYLLTAKIKLAAGADRAYFQTYIAPNVNNGANSFIESGSDPNTNHFLCFNTWNGWGTTNSSVFYDGDLSGSVYGLGRYEPGGTYGIYTATFTGKVYIALRAYTQANSGGDWFVDEVKFELQPED